MLCGRLKEFCDSAQMYSVAINNHCECKPTTRKGQILKGRADWNAGGSVGGRWQMTFEKAMDNYFKAFV